MRILGIDLGSSNIKAVEMDSAFGRYDIHDYHEQTLVPDKHIGEAIKELMQGLAKQPDRVVVGLGPNCTTFRKITLPTRDKKAIQASVGFELEDELPFAVDESVFDFVTLNQSKQGTDIHVAATLKRHLFSALEMWQQAQVDPEVVTTEVWAYRTILNRLTASTVPPIDGPVLLLQMGHQRTTIYLHWNGAPIFARELNWGGKDLTAAISEKFGVSLEQAEAIKLDRGMITAVGSSDPSTAEQLELSACLEESMTGLLTQLKQIELMSKSVTHHTIQRIYLSGGTSLLPGIGPWIESSLEIPIFPILALSSATTSGVTYSDQTDAKFLLAVALTFTLVGSERAHCLNFRKGGFAKVGTTRQINFKALKKPLLALGIVVSCLFLSLVIQSTVYRSRLQTTDIQLEKSVRSFYGQISSSALRTYMANPSMLRTSIQKEITKQRELNKLFGPNPNSPLDFLKTLSSTIPKEIVVDMTHFQSGISPTEAFGSAGSAASATFLVSNPQVAEKLTAVLNNKISHFERGKIEETADTNEANKKWKVTFSGKPTEDAYAK